MLWGNFSHARAGKRLLDQGGKTAELALASKLCALEASKLDAAFVSDVDSLIAAYAESSEHMRAAMIYPQVSSLEALDFARHSEDYRTRSEGLCHIRTLLREPLIPLELSSSEKAAASLLQMRKFRANVAHSLGLRCRPYSVADRERITKEICCCDDDEKKLPTASEPLRDPTSPFDIMPAKCDELENLRGSRLEKLVQDLFRIQDLNGNGLLEERELIKLNEKVDIVHYGKEANKAAVKEKFRTLFREKLDASGQPVPYPVFRNYILQMLGEIDTHEDAQELMMEQFIAEAETARATFHIGSSALPVDVAQLATLEITSFDTTVTEQSTQSGRPRPL